MEEIITKIKKNDILVYIYIAFFSIAFLQRLGKADINYFIKYIIAAIWIMIGIIKLYKSRFDFKGIKEELIFFLKIFFVPIFLMILYSLMLFIIGKANIAYFGRSLSASVSILITILAVFSTIYIFKEKSLKYTFISMISSFVIVIIYNIYNYGFEAFRGLINTFLNNSEAINFFEVHDLTFAAGIIFINYFYFQKKIDNRYNISAIIFPIIIMVMGFKRIQLIAISLIIAYIIIINLLKDKLKIIFIRATGIITAITCFLYVVVIKFGYLEHLMNILGINTMGRIHFYKWISSKVTMSPNFLGLGFGVTSKMMEVETKWPVATIHSDILKTYVEIGFIGFVLWITYYLIYSFNKILNKYGLNSAMVYFIITLYLFLLHFTDNTTTYFTTQYVYMIVCISYVLKNKKEKC